MTDRELLEAAAKAAGLGGAWDWPRGAKAPTLYRVDGGRAWDPLHDDGDALRLGHRLRLFTDVQVWPQSLSDFRRAIVRAAAATTREGQEP